MSHGAPGRHGRDDVAAGGRRSPRSAQADRHGGIMTNPIMPPSPARLTEDGRCPHRPPCPGALEPDRLAARLVARYPDQGWSLLCNGVVLLDDGDQLLPDGRIVSPAAASRSCRSKRKQRRQQRTGKAGEHHRPGAPQQTPTDFTNAQSAWFGTRSGSSFWRSRCRAYRRDCAPCRGRAPITQREF